ncbi:MAG: Trk system potassium transporter TrkA [Planctomycetes bacterium]|nr:Trk system potassium transporter TrkA [Planctomycetota bacterium]MCB9891100.1 Trk system potassium transporter TrkA [Planctomycetota bacterium]MCB9918868.1 Trk system potassium transporter TrkA [Planctomycetota bacterium]
MNILIIGMGEVGYHVAKVLSEAKHSVTVVDPDPAKIRRASEVLDVQSLLGDGTLPRVLDEADASSMDLVLCVTDDDRTNMLSCLLARRMGAAQGIVRVKDLDNYRNYRALLRHNILFDEILSLEGLAAEEIAKVVRRNQAVSLENFLEGHVTLRVLRVKEKSPLLGKPLKDIHPRGNVLIVAVRREGSTMIPGGDHCFAVDDEIYVLGKPSSVETFEGWVGHHRGRARNVVIYGGSRVAFHAARSLERHGVKIRMMVDDREASEWFAERLEHSTVLLVDGIDIEAFKEEHVGNADAFVAASDVDERNLLSCQIAAKLGCERTIALVSSSDYVDIYEEIGIARAVSPRLLCSDAIMKRVQAGKLQQLAAFDEGRAKVCTAALSKGSPLIGKSLIEAKFPKDCLIGAIQRQGEHSSEVLIPSGEDVLEEDDELILFMLSTVEQKVFEHLAH